MDSQDSTDRTNSNNETIELDDVPLSGNVAPSAVSQVDPKTSQANPSNEEDEETDDLPSREQCQLLTEEFASVTGTDTALAQFFLQDRHWDLEKSVNAYFESRPDAPTAAATGANNDQSDLLVTFDSKMVSSTARVSIIAPTHFTLLTWNIDGLEQSNLKKRTKAVIKTIESESVDIVFLQEVVAVVYSYMEERLPQYMFIAAGSEDYFTAMLLLRTTVYFDSHVLVNFDNSCMGRNLLEVQAHIGKCKLRLMTSHMESTAEFSEQRQQQLRTAFTRLTAGPSNVNAILAGDLNLRDKEVAAVGLPVDVVDVWESTGRRKESQYTWDLKRNTNKSLSSGYRPQCRFDRVYLRSGCGSDARVATARHFGLVGLQKVAGTQSYPSDHWGLLTHYDIVE